MAIRINTNAPKPEKQATTPEASDFDKIQHVMRTLSKRGEVFRDVEGKYLVRHDGNFIPVDKPEVILSVMRANNVSLSRSGRSAATEYLHGLYDTQVQKVLSFQTVPLFWGTNFRDRDGYNAETLAYLDTQDWEPIPEEITDEDIEEAKKIFAPVFEAFEYVSKDAGINAMGLIVAPALLGQDYMPKTFIVSGTEKDTGKTALCAIAKEVWGGGKFQALSNEQGKQFKDLKKLYGSRGLFSYTDNNRNGREIDSDGLSSLLDGRSDHGTIDEHYTTDGTVISLRKVTAHTGNGITAAGDLIRKTVSVRLQKPRSTRTITEVMEWIQQKGGAREIRWAVTVAVKQFLASDAPVRREGNFGAWQVAVQSVLEILGVEGVFDNPDSEDAKSYGEAMERGFMEAVCDKVTGSDNITDFGASDMLRWKGDGFNDIHPELFPEGKDNAMSLGGWFAQFRDRKIQGYILRSKIVRGRNKWIFVKIDDGE